jgi:drug/metabolite transporter (DMT)-like permease
MTDTSAAIMLALFSSACLGLALVVTQFGLRHVTAAAGVLVTIPGVAVLFWALAPFMLDARSWDSHAAAIFALVGLFFPGIVALLTFEANQRMGPTIAGALGGTAPIFAIGIAILFLGEQLTMLGGLATVAIVAGVMTLSWQPTSGSTQWPKRLLLLGLGAAALRGLAQALLKVGLMAWPNPFAAALIGYTVSTTSIVAGTRIRGRTLQLKWTTKGVLWFGLVGLCNGIAQLSMYGALTVGPVTLVAPTVATYPLFALAFSAILLLREHMTLQSAAGVVMTVAGVVGLLLVR